MLSSKTKDWIYYLSYTHIDLIDLSVRVSGSGFGWTVVYLCVKIKRNLNFFCFLKQIAWCVFLVEVAYKSALSTKSFAYVDVKANKNNRKNLKGLISHFLKKNQFVCLRMHAHLSLSLEILYIYIITLLMHISAS